jgi:hypothetical protein
MVEELAIDFPVDHWHTYVCPVRSIPGELDVIVHVYTGALDHPAERLTLLEGQALGWFDEAQAAQLEIGFEKKPVLLKFFAERVKGIV